MADKPEAAGADPVVTEAMLHAGVRKEIWNIVKPALGREAASRIAFPDDEYDALIDEILHAILKYGKAVAVPRETLGIVDQALEDAIESARHATSTKALEALYRETRADLQQILGEGG